VGVFVNEDIKKILKIRNAMPFSLVQLHGSEPVSLCLDLKKEGLKVIKVFSVGDDLDFDRLKPYEDHVDYFLFDTRGKYYGGNSIPFDWNLINAYPFQKPFFLGGGIGNDNIHQIRNIKNPFLYAIDGNSKLESSPGQKDLEKVKLFKKLFDRINK
jgi:phosphoribosylanthranilate isomerase